MGIIHRDLKPGNILFHADGRILLPILVWQKSCGTPEMPMVPGAGLTNEGAIIGTPEYLSPEQGTGTPVDYRTDIYSLGVVLYQMLAGRVPFVGPTAVAVAIKHAIETPPPLTQFNPLVPKSVEAVVMKALAKDPAQRYRSTGELARILRATVANEQETNWILPGTRQPIGAKIPMIELLSDEEADPISDTPDAPTYITDQATMTSSSPNNILQTDDMHNLETSIETHIETHIAQKPAELVMQEKVAALQTVMMPPESNQKPSGKHAVPDQQKIAELQRQPTALTLMDATVEQQELKVQPSNEEQPELTVVITHETLPKVEPVANVVETPAIPLKRNRGQGQSNWTVLIGILLVVLIIGGGTLAYFHFTTSSTTSAQGHTTTQTAHNQTTPQTDVTSSTPTMAFPVKAAIPAGALLYSTPAPLANCDKQGGQ